MPRGKIGGEEQCREGDGDGQGAARQMDRLTEQMRDQPQEGQRQREPPEAGRDWPDPGIADEERPGGERDIAD